MLCGRVFFSGVFPGLSGYLASDISAFRADRLLRREVRKAGFWLPVDSPVGSSRGDMTQAGDF